MDERISKQINRFVPLNLRRMFDSCFRVALLMLSVLVLGAVTVDYGFELDPKEMGWIESLYGAAWWIYFALFTLKLFANLFRIQRKRRAMTVVMGLMLYMSAMPKFWPAADAMSLWSAVCDFVGGKYFVIAVLLLFAITDLSRSVIGFINKNTNPALVMVGSFAAIIFIGTILLLVPRSTAEHIRLPVIDALFTATSAVCVTGLSTVDIASTFTLEGRIVIMLLVQVGGLGVMTLTSFFAMFYMGNTGFYNQFTLRDMVGGTENSQSLVAMLLYIFGFTFIIELVGAVAIWLSVHGHLGMSLHDELFFAVFHSVSAFCNAGFSTLQGNLGNAALMSGGNSFYIIISLLVILGSIGFPILVNFRNILAYYVKRLWSLVIMKRPDAVRYNHLANINTKIVLVTTAVLLVGGTAAMALIEWNGAFDGLTVGRKLTQSFFHAVVPRTAGFNSVDLTHLSLLAVIVYIFLMWVGGASQSTAGGVKVNTLAVMYANFAAVVRGRSRVTLMGRELTDDSVRRASAVVFGSVAVIVVGFVTLVLMEPALDALALLFEVVSAFCTVGSSLNITPQLGDDAKLVVSLLMFTGRVGLIAIATCIVRHSGDLKYRYPKDNIIIN